MLKYFYLQRTDLRLKAFSSASVAMAAAVLNSDSKLYKY